MPSQPKRKAAKVTKSSFKDFLKAQDAIMRYNPSKPKNLSSSKIQMKGPGYCLSGGVSKDITSNKLNGSHKQLSDPNIFFPTEKRKQLPPKNSMLVLKSEDNISSFLVQAFSKGGGGKPLKQIQAVYKKTLAPVQENSHAHAHVSASTFGQFLIAPVKSTYVDGGRVLGSFQETE